MNDEKSKPNYFVRTLIVILAGFCGYLVYVTFTKGEPAYTISAVAFSTLVLMTIIVLSEAFNHLSLGKVLSLSKKVSEEKTAKEEVKKENAELRESVLKLSIAVRQTQTNTTINALPSELLKYLGVTKADEKDKAQDEETATAAPQETQVRSFAPEREVTGINRVRIRRALSEEALERCLKKIGVPEADLSREVTFTSTFQNIDPIMERPIVFDAYMRTPSREQFFEALPYIGSATFERAYVMLAKNLFYRQAKQVQAELILVISKLPESNELQQMNSRFGERFLQAFQPAISNNLLRVEFVEFSEAEYLAIAQKISNE
jgi:cell division protein FtsL